MDLKLLSEWASQMLVALGLMAGAWRDAKKAGRREQMQDAHETRLNKQDEELDRMRIVQAAHGERIGKVEARCEAVCGSGD